MAGSGDHIKALLNSHADGDDESFYAVVAQIAAQEARHGHNRLAAELKEAIEASRRPQRQRSEVTPISRPRGELVKRVNEKREEEREMLLPKVTPHTLRRTYACLSFWVGRELPWVMDQIGHDDSRMTVGVYGQATKRRRVDRDLAWHLMRFADEPAERPGHQRS